MTTPFSFDPRAVAPSGARAIVPEGWYSVGITASEYKPSKTGGAYIELKFTVVDGAHRGESVITRLNVVNNSETATRIAYEQLSAVCHAAGVEHLGSPAQLVGRTLQARITVEPDIGTDGKTRDVNAVKGYRYIDGTDIVPNQFGPVKAGAAAGPAGWSAPVAAAAPAPLPIPAPAPAPAPAPGAWQPPAGAQPAWAPPTE